MSNNGYSSLSERGGIHLCVRGVVFIFARGGWYSFWSERGGIHLCVRGVVFIFARGGGIHLCQRWVVFIYFIFYFPPTYPHHRQISYAKVTCENKLEAQPKL